MDIFDSRISSLISRTFFSKPRIVTIISLFRVHFLIPSIYFTSYLSPRNKESKNNPRKTEPGNNRYRLLNVQHYRDLWVELLRYLFFEIFKPKKVFLLKFKIWYQFQSKNLLNNTLIFLNSPVNKNYKFKDAVSQKIAIK